MANSQACLLALTMGRVSMAFSQVLVESFSSSHLHIHQDTLGKPGSTTHLQAELELLVRQSVAWQLSCCDCRAETCTMTGTAPRAASGAPLTCLGQEPFLLSSWHTPP